MNRKSLLLLFFVFSVFLLQAQERTISGVVTLAESNEPLIGVTVLEKGTTNGAFTDIDGKYTLKISSGEATLIFTYVGLANQEIPVGEESTINAQLRKNVQQFEQVVVIGYGTQTRSKITGAVSSVGAEQIAETPVLRVEQTLQGRTAGVQISQNSGSPGSTLNVRVRGISTIKNSDPLYIVDGFPVGGIDYLNPGDIESINVLKDAASAAIYGARGANGVILITTKQGKKDEKASISYATYYGIQNPWKKQNLLNAREYAILSNEAYRADGDAPRPELIDPDALGEGTDWQNAIFEAAPIQNHQVTILGGSEATTYSLNGSHFLQDGIVGGEKARFKRSTFRVRTEHDLFDRLKVGQNIAYTHLKRNGLPENNEFNSPLVRALNMDPVTPVRKPDGTYAYSQFSDTDITNPVNAIEQTHDLWTTNRIVGNLSGELRIIDGLKARSTFSLDHTLGTRDVFNPRFDLSNDLVLSEAPAGEKNLINGVLQEDNKWNQWQWENTLNYHKTLNEKHDMDFLLGNSMLAWNHVYHGGSKSDLPSNDPKFAFIDNGEDALSQRSWGGKEEFSFLSYFGRVNYQYDNKYLFSATMRADGSSRFGKNNRFGYFPSVSAGWVISEEAFMKDVEWLSFLKLRLSWGQNGNAEIGNYSYTSRIYSGLNYTFGPDEVITNGSGPTTVSNPDLRWETNTQTDIGLDMEFLDGKINFTTDLYLKNTTDMLAVVPIPLIVGYDPDDTNVGNVTNKGIEIAAEYRNRDNKFKYEFGGNIAFVKNEVTSLGEDGDPISSGSLQSASANIARTEVGHAIASFYGYVTDGIFQNQGEVEAHATQNGAAPGDIRFKDLNSDGVIDQEDQTFIGNPTPDFTYGLTGKAMYMGFDFSFFLLGSHGNEIYNGTVRYDFTYANRPVSALNRWTGEGSSNFEPRVINSDPNQNVRISDRFVENGSFLRIKNMQLGYTLPKKILSKLRMSDFRIYVAAQNLFTFTQYSGLDPEIGSRGSLELGIDRGFYPQARTYLTGLSIKF